MYPSADPKNVNMVEFPGPDASLNIILEMVSYWAQMLFGISDYSAGLESKIDPSAPAKKAEIVVAQGNVRLNQIIKRKNKTLKDIFKRWFLLYKENMPPNKFMRIAGYSKDNPWKFQAVTLEDFALKSIPDFELTGNVLNSNKALEANKALAVYQVLVANPFFSPQTLRGMNSLHSLTKWLIDKLDETGLSSFLPELPGSIVQTPEEENARFMQGDTGEPTEEEDDVQHIKVHRNILLDQTIPDEVKQNIVNHISKHVKQMQTKITQQMALAQMGVSPEQMQAQGQGGQNAVPGRNTQVPARQTSAVLPGQSRGMGGY